MSDVSKSIREALNMKGSSDSRYYKISSIEFYEDHSIKDVAVETPNGTEHYAEPYLICFMLNNNIGYIPMLDQRVYKGIKLLFSKEVFGLALIESINTSGL